MPSLGHIRDYAASGSNRESGRIIKKKQSNLQVWSHEPLACLAADAEEGASLETAQPKQAAEWGEAAPAGNGTAAGPSNGEDTPADAVDGEGASVDPGDTQEAAAATPGGSSPRETLWQTPFKYAGKSSHRPGGFMKKVKPEVLHMLAALHRGDL